MFDLSVLELGVIAVVALLVLGPERLPKAARTVGFYVRKARQSWFSVRAEFERELAAEELKRSLKLDEIHATLDHTASEVRRGLSELDPTRQPSAAEEDEGLSPEERARQLEAAPLEPEPDDGQVPALDLQGEDTPAQAASEHVSEMLDQRGPIADPGDAAAPSREPPDTRP